MRPLIVLLSLPSLLAAQMPGVPVLQNAWATPGLVAAVNFGGGAGSVWAAAGAWAPGAARFQLSAGGGMQSGVVDGSRGVYGARAAMPLAQIMGGAMGIAAFAGVGGGGASSEDSTLVKMSVPAGVAVGYRMSLGATRGISVYATPSYQWASGDAGSTGLIRSAFGVDVGLARNIGVTGGVEFGQSAGAGRVGASGSTYGVGASYAF